MFWRRQSLLAASADMDLIATREEINSVLALISNEGITSVGGLPIRLAVADAHDLGAPMAAKMFMKLTWS